MNHEVVITSASTLDFGSVPAWIALLGALVALLTYWTSRRDRVRSTAARVYVQTTFTVSQPPHAEDHVTATLFNDGELAIFDVWLNLCSVASRRLTWRWRSHSTWMTVANPPVELLFTCVRPNTQVDPQIVHDVSLFAQRPLKSAHFSSPWMIRFTDGAGRRWVRWPDGRLSRLRRHGKA